MKKFFTFFAAVLMAGSMMATDVTLRASDTWTKVGSSVSGTKDGVTVTMSWSSDISYMKMSGFNFYANEAGYVTVDVEATDETVAYVALTDGWSAAYEGEGTHHTIQLEEGEELNFDYVVVTLEEATALENTTATVKATKLVENGQVVIIRDGVRYNAVGAKL